MCFGSCCRQLQCIQCTDGPSYAYAFYENQQNNDDDEMTNTSVFTFEKH